MKTVRIVTRDVHGVLRMTGGDTQSAELFEDRKKAAEAKFRQEQALAFRAEARRAKLAGWWAAERLGLDGDAAGAYAADMVGIAAVGALKALETRIAEDFAAHSIPLAEGELARRLGELLAEARRQVAADLEAARPTPS